MVGKKSGKKRIGLALGSGAARGMAHIGVLKVLEEEGIEVDVIAGTSIGALIGALYAAGVTPMQMEEIASNVDWKQAARLIDPIIPTSGIIDGKNVGLFIEELLPVNSFQDLKIPLGVIATDIESGEPLIFTNGDLPSALRAAIAFPGIFTPVRFGDRFLVDGGLCNPVPADIARELGADTVIGVCAIPEVRKAKSDSFENPPSEKEESKTGIFDFLNSQTVENILRDIWRPGQRNEQPPESESTQSRKPPGIFKICAQSVAIMENQINALRLERNDIDIMIRPDLNGITLLEFHRAAEAIKAGEQATRKELARICGN